MSRECIERAITEVVNIRSSPEKSISRINRESVEVIERLLTDEREPMECGHPKACWIGEQVWKGESDAVPGKEATWTVAPYCSACVEREKVREMCLATCRMAKNDAKERALRVGTYFWKGREAGADACIDGIEQLDLDGHGDGKK